MAGAWVEHVKTWSKTKEMKYGEAMRHPECKASYQKSKPNADNGHKFEKNSDSKKSIIKKETNEERKIMNPNESENVESMVKKEVKVKKLRMNKKTQI